MTLDAQTIAQAKSKLYSAVMSDVLDDLGYRDQAVKPHIRPLDEDLVMFGQARTGSYREVYHIEPGENPYELEIALIDDLKPGEVVVLGCGGSDRIAPWGELLTTASRARGAVGCLTDGMVRDVRFIREMKFPVFAGAIGPLDSKGRGVMTDLDKPVLCGGVLINPGDYILGDVDGVVAVPQEVAAEAIEKALAKAQGEDKMRRELAEGAYLKDMFEKYGIL